MVTEHGHAYGYGYADGECCDGDAEYEHGRVRIFAPDVSARDTAEQGDGDTYAGISQPLELLALHTSGSAPTGKQGDHRGQKRKKRDRPRHVLRYPAGVGGRPDGYRK